MSDSFCKRWLEGVKTSLFWEHDPHFLLNMLVEISGQEVSRVFNIVWLCLVARNDCSMRKKVWNKCHDRVTALPSSCKLRKPQLRCFSAPGVQRQKNETHTWRATSGRVQHWNALINCHKSRWILYRPFGSFRSIWILFHLVHLWFPPVVCIFGNDGVD